MLISSFLLGAWRLSLCALSLVVIGVRYHRRQRQSTKQTAPYNRPVSVVAREMRLDEISLSPGLRHSVAYVAAYFHRHPRRSGAGGHPYLARTL